MPVEKPQSSARKPYSPPKLIVYGTMRDITKANTKSGVTDGSGHPQFKFSAA